MSTRLRSVNPRPASAAITSGCVRIASSTAWNSSIVKFGVTPGMSSKETTASPVRSTVASYVWFSARSSTHGERGAGNGVTRAPCLDRSLGRFFQLYGGEPETVAHVLLAAEDGGGLLELIGRQRFEWMLRHGGLPSDG